MADLRITHVSVLLEDGTILQDQNVDVTDGRFSRIAPADEVSSAAAACAAASHATGTPAPTCNPGTESSPRMGFRTEFSPVRTLDGRGKLLMPGLADCHMHTGQQLLKGRVLDELPMIWTRIMLPFESTLTPEKMRLSAELAALEMIRSGTTAFIDAGSYYMKEAVKVYRKSGLRGVLSLSTMDEKGLPGSIATTTEEAVSLADDFYAFCKDDLRLKPAYALRSLISCSENLIRQTAEHADERQALLQAHMNEYAGEVNFHLQHFQMRPYEYLDSLGVLSDRFIGAHSIMLSEHEKTLLRDRNVKVCHCPFSNCGKGIPDTPSLLEQGICVGLGTDGAAHGGLSLWNEMKIFRSVMNAKHGVAQGNPSIMPAKQILSMATKDGYHLMHEDGGVIAAGKKADFITIHLRQPHLYPTGNLVNTLLECVTAADVCDVAVDGQLLMKNREVLTLDEERILSDAGRYLNTLQ